MHTQQYTLSSINQSVLTDYKTIINDAEKRYQSSIDQAVAKVLDHGGHEIIMLAGPSSSGKTTTAEKIAREIRKRGVSAYTISLDDFYASRESVPLLPNGDPDYETVYALDLPLISKCLNEFATIGHTELPIFDFTQGRRSSKTNVISLDEGDVIIVEGLHALNPAITGRLPKENLLKIYITVSSRIYDDKGKTLLKRRGIRFVRRAVRDYYFRNSSIENTCMLWENVQQGENKYLFPFEELSDMKINSIHEYEPCVFKNIAPLLFDDVSPNSKYYDACKEMAEVLNKFESIPVSQVPAESLLREFIGK
ncbi:MAG: nucleoside kinase [Oscillospiraceae bacterium]|jgi:uridine kinase|nr:nucleoside kinase [Oscillospiraceae bacterium]